MKQTVLYSLLALVFVLGACTYTMKIQDGAMAYERKQYAVAVNISKAHNNLVAHKRNTSRHTHFNT